MNDIDNLKSSKNYDKSDLEYQYSPSKWSKRMSADAVIKTHIAKASAASEKAKSSIPYEVLRYGDGKNQLIDLFGTSLPNDAPVLVYVHGGYWQELERSISAYLVEPLYKNGIRVAVAGYDLAPNVTLGRIVTEMVELDEFMSEWSAKVGAKDIWYAGHSAGAYLIAAILKSRGENERRLSSYPIRGMFFISGIYDLVPLVDTYVNNELKLTRDEARERSLVEINLKDLSHMVFLTVVAEHDSDEFHKQSCRFHEGKGNMNKLEGVITTKVVHDKFDLTVENKMLHQQIPASELLVVTGRDHFDVVEELNNEEYILMQKIINLVLHS